MFAKLKKKIAEEAATAPRSGVRLPRTVSKESIASAGADSGDDFASDSSSSRDDLPAQLLRRNDQIRKLEARLSASIKKLQEQNDVHQASRTKMAEGMAFALEKKDQEWMEKLAIVEKEKAALTLRLDQSLKLFQGGDELDELGGFQQQELAQVKHMLQKKEELLSQREQELQQKEADVQSVRRGVSETWEELRGLKKLHQESCSLNSELQAERQELLLLREGAEQRAGQLEGRVQELQSVLQQVSEDFQKSQTMASTLESSIHHLQVEHDALKLKAAVTTEDKERLMVDLQKKVVSLERRLQGNLSQDEHLQELLQEKSSLEECLEESRGELLAARTNHADTVTSLEAQVCRMSSSLAELQTLLRHKDDSSRAYRQRTDAQIVTLEQQLVDRGNELKAAGEQLKEKQQQLVRLQGDWEAQRTFLEQQTQEKSVRLEDSVTALQDRVADLDALVGDLRSVLGQRTEELQHCRDELSSRQAESVELTKALEEVTRQRDDVQTQVGQVSTVLQEAQQELSRVTETLKLREESIHSLQSEVRRRAAAQVQLQQEVERRRAQMERMERDGDARLSSLTQTLDGCHARMSFLEVEVETLTEQLQGSGVCEEQQNGSVTGDDLDQVQKVNRDLEQQLSDKNRTIKQLQQRLAELKRTLQKELKLKSEPEAEGKERLPETRADKQEGVSPEPPAAPSLSPRPPSTTVTNASDLNDSREINFEYLKHVVLKFMSSREAEAYQLIRAVSVLLNFTHEEEDMLKQTLEYKMSWFGSKPSPRGVIRPSVSGSSTSWS
ncbi:golgin subfamily A member 1 isoform X2 [Antennarius striatus]|uniref:golgin subfamily A member 1 isoform X2 n=1 Tax=Antennarius striatus TaxID=241820 RepID=UPI0035ADE86D